MRRRGRLLTLAGVCLLSTVCGVGNVAGVEFSVAAAAASPDPVAGQPARHQYSSAPTPQARPEAVPATVGAAEPPRPAGAPSTPPSSPLLIIALGLALGFLVYLLWGDAGRLGLAHRQGLLAHIVGRPAQRLHVGRVCLQCGRLHLVFSTRRDLWRAGSICSVACFVDAEAADSAALDGERTAVTMRELFVHPER
jgi:hypothetical protein